MYLLPYYINLHNMYKLHKYHKYVNDGDIFFYSCLILLNKNASEKELGLQLSAFFKPVN